MLLLVMSKFQVSIHVLCAMYCVSLFYQNIISSVEFVFDLLLSAVCFSVTFRVSFACLFVADFHHHHHHLSPLV